MHIFIENTCIYKMAYNCAHIHTNAHVSVCVLGGAALPASNVASFSPLDADQPSQMAAQQQLQQQQQQQQK